jgi:hypothetical protein
MPKHTVSLAITSGLDTFNVQQDITDAQARAVDETLAPGATNVEVDIVLTNAQVKSLALSCQGGDLTIKTNSTGAPGDTVAMTDGQVTEYCPSGTGVQAIGTNPFASANVTKLYLSSTAGTVFKLRAIVTATNG